MNMFGKYSREGKKLFVNCPAIIIKTDGTDRKCFNGNHKQIITACRKLNCHKNIPRHNQLPMHPNNSIIEKDL